MLISLLLLLIAVAGDSSAERLAWSEVPTAILTKRMSFVLLTNHDRGIRLEEMFKEAGCAGDHLTRGRVNKNWNNIICTLPGSTEEMIVIGAHYHHVQKGVGAVDNWPGSSLLPSLYQTIAASERHYTYVFVGFAEEEKGCLHSDKDQLTAIVEEYCIETYRLVAATLVYIDQSFRP